MKHVLVAYSWSMGNIGDIGITPGLLNLMQRHIPELPVTVMTSQEVGSKDHAYLTDYFPRYSPGCKVVGNPFRSVINNGEGRSEAWDALVQRWGPVKLKAFEDGVLTVDDAEALVYDLMNVFPHELIKEFQTTRPDVSDAFGNAGFALFTSGTTLNFGRMGKRSFWRFSLLYALPMIIARALGIPYGISSQSFDALEWPSDILFRQLFADAEFVFCRDTDSLAYLKQRNLISKRMGYRPDTTFFFGGADEAWADEYMARHGLEEGRFITLTIRSSTQPGPLMGVMSKERSEAHMVKLRAFIEALTAQTDLKVLICPEVKYEIQPARELLYDQVSKEAQEKCVWMDSFWNTEQAYSIYRRARMVVSMEMHSIIMSVGIGTPLLHPQFAESGRKARMVRDIGLGDWLFDIDAMESSELLEAALRIHQDHDHAKARVSDALHRLDQLGAGLMALVRQTGRY